MYDNVCKFLAETFSADFATWLLGEPVELTQLSPSELSLEPIRADALILLASKDFVLHIEFQTDPDPDLPFRMLDYRLRVYRKFPNKQMRQVVIYLRPSGSDLTQKTAFQIPGTYHEFEVIRLWEQPTEIFMNSAGLLPFAALSKTEDRTRVLERAATQIQAIPEPRLQRSLSASTAILAGLLLDKATIQKILRSEIMRESVIYQDIIAEGIAVGTLAGELKLVVRLLTRRIGLIAPNFQTQIERLSVEQLDDLAVALLDFSQPDDLANWLSLHSKSE